MTVSFSNGTFQNGGLDTSIMNLSGVSTANYGALCSSIWNTENLANRFNYTETQEAYNIQGTNQDDVLLNTGRAIGSYLQQGQEDNAMEAFNDLIETMKTQTRYTTIKDNELALQTEARKIIEQSLADENGTPDLELIIRDCARDAKGVEYQQKIYGEDKVDSVTQEQLLKAMCNINEYEESMQWYDNVANGLEWFFNPWERWFSGNRVD